jgi:hypothetical protein
MEESPLVGANLHTFRIQYTFRDQLQTASLTISQKADHDEYAIIPDEEALAKEFGSQTFYLYYDQHNPLRSIHLENDYIKSIKTGVQEFLDSKHS